MATMADREVRGGSLRAVLTLDALASGGMGVLLAVLGAPVLASWFGLPAALLVPVGIGLVGYAGWLRFVATRPVVSRAAVRVIVAGNLAWVLASVVLVLAGWFSPTGLGVGFVLVQAAAVAGLAALQYRELRRPGR